MKTRCATVASHQDRRGVSAIEILMTSVLLIVFSITMFCLGRAAAVGLHDYVSVMGGSPLI